jgi:class 3 adenylate cyclase
MHGVASISQLSKGVDLFNKADWKRALGGDLGFLAIARDPFTNGFAGRPIIPKAVWGFEPRTSVVRKIVGNLEGNVTGLSSRRDKARGQLEMFAALAPFLLWNSTQKPGLDGLCASMSRYESVSEYNSHTESELRALSLFLEFIKGRYALRWVDIETYTYAILFDKKHDEAEGGERSLRADTCTALMDIVGLIHDYEKYRLPIWYATPSINVTDARKDGKLLRNMFSDPMSFDPSEDVAKDTWLWPWQRCIKAAKGPRLDVSSRSVPTTSLVLDIRNSTTAMGLTVNADKFAEFIDKVVSKARHTILKYGGFFDKETGDGVVGHFWTMPNPVLSEAEGNAAEMMAVRAAQRIVLEIQDLCIEHQHSMQHGLDGLGGAVGIHSGSAVWVADEKQIRAIGDSVISAKRLCDVAGPGEIVISSQTYRCVCRPGQSIDGLLFQKCPAHFKEYPDRVGTYAYVAKVVGQI